MSDPGYFAVHRSVWEHDLFEPALFSEREAWMWLVSSAVWKPSKVRIGNKMVALDRGELAFSERFLAEKWQWAKSKVHRFLALLEIEKMIARNSDHGLNHITICNYDKYQTPWTTQRTTSGPETDHERTKEEEPNKLIIDGGGGSARPKLISDEAQDTADAMAAACGFPDPKACPFGWYGAAIWVQKCLNEGWSPDLMIEGTRATAAKKRDGPIESFKYLEKPLARFIAEHSRPLPKVEVLESEKLTVVKNVPKSSPFDAAYDRVLEKLNAGFAGGPSEERDGPATGEDHARLLAYRQRQ